MGKGHPILPAMNIHSLDPSLTMSGIPPGYLRQSETIWEHLKSLSINILEHLGTCDVLTELEVFRQSADVWGVLRASGNMWELLGATDMSRANAGEPLGWVSQSGFMCIHPSPHAHNPCLGKLWHDIRPNFMSSAP